MDLVGGIINYFNTGSDENIIAVQALLPAGNMIADYDWGAVASPYVIVSELTYENFAEGMGFSYRIDNQIVQFEAFAKNRNDVVSLLDAIQTAYIHQNDLGTDEPLNGRPRKLDRLISWSVEHWRGILNLSYYLEQKPQ